MPARVCHPPSIRTAVLNLPLSAYIYTHTHTHDLSIAKTILRFEDELTKCSLESLYTIVKFYSDFRVEKRWRSTFVCHYTGHRSTQSASTAWRNEVDKSSEDPGCWRHLIILRGITIGRVGRESFSSKPSSEGYAGCAGLFTPNELKSCGTPTLGWLASFGPRLARLAFTSVNRLGSARLDSAWLGSARRQIYTSPRRGPLDYSADRFKMLSERTMWICWRMWCCLVGVRWGEKGSR